MICRVYLLFCSYYQTLHFYHEGIQTTPLNVVRFQDLCNRVKKSLFCCNFGTSVYSLVLVDYSFRQVFDSESHNYFQSNKFYKFIFLCSLAQTSFPTYCCLRSRVWCLFIRPVALLVSFHSEKFCCKPDSFACKFFSLIIFSSR